MFNDTTWSFREEVLYDGRPSGETSVDTLHLSGDGSYTSSGSTFRGGVKIIETITEGTWNVSGNQLVLVELDGRQTQQTWQGTWKYFHDDFYYHGDTHYFSYQNGLLRFDGHAWARLSK